MGKYFILQKTHHQLITKLLRPHNTEQGIVMWVFGFENNESERDFSFFSNLITTLVIFIPVCSVVSKTTKFN